MKFIKEKVSRLTGETEVEFKASDSLNGNPCSFKIIAGPAGVRFEGVSHHLHSIMELEEFAAMVDAAFTEHKRLKPRLEAPGGFRVQ